MACASNGRPGACFLSDSRDAELFETKLGGVNIFYQKMKWLCLFWR